MTSLALISALALNGCIFSGGGTTSTTVNTYTFNYDKLSQLIGVSLNGTASESYTFDKSGNLTGLTSGGTTSSFSYNSLNQQTAPAGQVFDAKGQTTTTNGRTYEWDDQGRITAVVMGTQRSEFAYDGMSRRTKITEFTNGAMTSKKLYFWLGGSIVCERDGLQTGFPLLKQFFGQGEVRGTTKLYYTFDHLGSIRELVDAAGAIQAEYRYSTYGERTKTSGNLESDWGYSGLWHHQASGLDLATYRAYDAASKRWISRDPLGEGSDRTLYSYCGNNPISRRDALGLAYSNDLTPWQMEQIDAGIQEIRDQGFTLEADLLSRTVFGSGNGLPDGTAAMTSPYNGLRPVIWIKTCGPDASWKHVDLTMILFHEAQHLKQKFLTGDITDLGIRGHWLGDDVAKYNLEAPAYGAEHLLRDAWYPNADQAERNGLDARMSMVTRQLTDLRRAAGLPRRPGMP